MKLVSCNVAHNILSQTVKECLSNNQRFPQWLSLSSFYFTQFENMEAMNTLTKKKCRLGLS